MRFISSVPPPTISGCNVSQAFDTGIAIRWTTPADCGGRTDCYYQIKIDDGSPQQYSPPVFQPNTQETFTVENLQQDTTYQITVSVHNGVSDQDPENARNRECTFVAATVSGSKYDQQSLAMLLLTDNNYAIFGHTGVFMLGGVTYLNNMAVLLEDIDSTNSLTCTTTHASCCTEENNKQGRFLYPDGSPVTQSSSSSQSFYMTQNQGSISLYRQPRDGDSPPLGSYRCEIPDSRGNMQNLQIRIGEATFRVCVCVCVCVRARLSDLCSFRHNHQRYRFFLYKLLHIYWSYCGNSLVCCHCHHTDLGLSLCGLQKEQDEAPGCKKCRL